MRKISAGPILFFSIIITVVIVLAILSTVALVYFVPLGGYKTLASVIIAIFLVYLYAIAAYRLFLKLFPLLEGPIDEGSRQEFIYQVYLLFFLILFYQLIRTKLIPVPVLRLIYLSLGARLGANTYSSGTLLDPWFTAVGDNTIIGEDSLMYAHAIEGRRLSHQRIRIGSNVTIGAKSIIMSGVTIDDNAVIGAGAVVTKNTRIGGKEVWGGVPAKRLDLKAKEDRNAG